MLDLIKNELKEKGAEEKNFLSVNFVVFSEVNPAH